MKNETAVRELKQEFPNLVIRASAGTGKTFALSNRYLRLLASGAECQTILATTFTKKGAGEILDRIIGRLSDAALNSGRAQTLSQQLDWQISQTRAAEILQQLLRSLHRLEVGTLDSFFSRIGKVFSLELGLPPNWDIVEVQQMQRLVDAAISQVLQTESSMELLSLMGKGEVARRVATVLQETVEQIYSVYRESGNEPWNKILRTQSFLSDETLEQVLMEMEQFQTDRKSLAEQWVKVLEALRMQDWDSLIELTSFQNFLSGNFKFGQVKLSPEVLTWYEKLVQQCRAYVEDMAIKQNLSTQQLLEKFDGFLQKAQSQTGKLRFEDVTKRLQEFVQSWDAERCSFRLDQQIQHVLLDEFQDTSLAQWQVLRPFAVKVTTKRDELRSFFCVGDMKQAIYGWRGGIAEIFDLVTDDLENLNTDTLTKSYRSAPPVIDLVNQVFSQVANYRCDDTVIETAVETWADWFQLHSTNRQDLAGYVTIEKSRHEVDRGDDEARDRFANQRIDEKTVERIQQLVERLPADKSIGVIVRTNAHVSRLIAQLQAVGIHASEEGGSSLTDSAAIEVILSAMTLADHPGDSLARFHLSHSPLASSLGLLPEDVGNQSENQERGIQAAAKLRARLMLEGYGGVVEDLARQLVPHCTRRELSRLQQLVQVAYAHASQPDLWELRPKRFADFVRDEVRVTDPSGSQVRVMTVHKAKGLEFDVVVFPIPQRSSSWSGSIPAVVTGRATPTSPINFVTRYHGKKIRKLLSKEVQQLFEEDLQRDIREAMCVLYVALTRAAHATHVIVTSNAKPDHKSAAGLLIATVCPDATATEGIVYEAGDPNWHQQTSVNVVNSEDAAESSNESASESAGQVDLSGFYLPADAALVLQPLSVQSRSGRGNPHERPSHLAGGDETTINALLPTLGGQNQEQRELLRCCFDLVQWLDQQTPTAQQLEVYLREQHPSSEPKAAIAQFYQIIEHEEVRKLLSLKSYQSMHLAQFSAPDSLGLEANRLEVQTARRFSMSTTDGMLDGVIDRLVLVYEGDRLIGADVIDLKTEHLTSPLLQNKVAFYAPQLEAYRTAVADFTGLPLAKIAVRVVFLQHGQVVNFSVVEVSIDEPSGKPGRSPRNSKPTSVPVRTDTTKQNSVELNSVEPNSVEPKSSKTNKSTGPKKPNINRPSKGSPYRQQRLWED